MQISGNTNHEPNVISLQQRYVVDASCSPKIVYSFKTLPSSEQQSVVNVNVFSFNAVPNHFQTSLLVLHVCVTEQTVLSNFLF